MSTYGSLLNKIGLIIISKNFYFFLGFYSSLYTINETIFYYMSESSN